MHVSFLFIFMGHLQTSAEPTLLFLRGFSLHGSALASNQMTTFCYSEAYDAHGISFSSLGISSVLAGPLSLHLRHSFSASFYVFVVDSHCLEVSERFRDILEFQISWSLRLHPKTSAGPSHLHLRNWLLSFLWPQSFYKILRKGPQKRVEGGCRLPLSLRLLGIISCHANLTSALKYKFGCSSSPCTA